jgi:uncharacterized membrane protein YidH (DUF202 family)
MAFAPGPQLFDDPVSRTRMAWVRTVLAVIVLGFLLVRGVIVLDAPRYLAYLSAAVTVLVVVFGLLRFTFLARHAPARSSATVRMTVVGGVLTLVAIGLVVTLATDTA